MLFKNLMFGDEIKKQIIRRSVEPSAVDYLQISLSTRTICLQIHAVYNFYSDSLGNVK